MPMAVPWSNCSARWVVRGKVSVMWVLLLHPVLSPTRLSGQSSTDNLGRSLDSVGTTTKVNNQIGSLSLYANFNTASVKVLRQIHYPRLLQQLRFQIESMTVRVCLVGGTREHYRMRDLVRKLNGEVSLE